MHPPRLKTTVRSRPSIDHRLAALLIGMGAVAFNLRPAITAVGPVLPDMRDDLGLSSLGASILTALPLLCFAFGSAAAPVILRRHRAEHVIIGAMALLIVGQLVRVGPDVAAVVTGTVIAGAAIAVVNVLLPVMVKRNAPDRVGLATGSYVMTLTLGAALGAGLTVPFAEAVGGGWRVGLVLWVAPVIPALAYWMFSPRSPGRLAEAPTAAVPRRIDWPVTVFFGVQSGVFYSAVGWLPTVLQDHGLSSAQSGAVLSVSVALGIPIGLLAPVVAMRRADHRIDVAGFLLLAAAGLVGLVALPALPLLWVCMFGLGVGGTFPLGLMMIVTRSRSPREAEQTSSAAQTLGYGMAIVAPIMVGVLHDLTGGWTVPLAALAALLIGLGLPSGLAAAGGRGAPAPG
jgi:CP family cyanate transporter-like MFS transporter